MPWNYRVMRRTDQTGAQYYCIVEAHYQAKGDSLPSSWTEGESAPIGESATELLNDLAWMLTALTKPVLDEDGKELCAQIMAVDELEKLLQTATDKPAGEA